MIEFTTLQLYHLIANFFWPFVRILAFLSSAPVFSNRSVPMTTKIGLGFAISLLIAPNIPPLIEHDPLSWSGLLILIQQLLIGISIGFSMQIIFAGIGLAGEMISMTMGLGFGAFFDPQSQGRSTSISQLMTAFAILLFIGCDFHLLFIESLANSFKTMPVSYSTINKFQYQELASLGSHIFSAGLQLSLPIVTILLIMNMALGILNKSAPQLNMFGIGFPLTLLTGFIMFKLMLPYLIGPILLLLHQGVELIKL
ncbi:MAG: flagellar biosynthetic protein FliR [Methylococcaceae bacterium]